MAHSLSAKKRVRQNTKRRVINRARRSQVKTLIRHFEATVGQGDAKAAAEQLPAIARKLDKAGGTSTMHKKTAARKKSRLAKRLNALKAKQITPA
ncbi:MAG: 30S ribosomal protein S20 [Sedimentisphaerales bacterium]|nr:30S ribosomal protein S20 [Sedimentisphaerales bacterium]